MFNGIAGVNVAMIKRFGSVRVTERLLRTGTEYDPTITPVEGSVTGMMAKFTKDTIDGEFRSGDAVLVCLPNDDILTGDKVLIGSERWGIGIATPWDWWFRTFNGLIGSERWGVVRLLPIQPGSTVLLKRAHIRK
jgi:hypothetical protein